MHCTTHLILHNISEHKVQTTCRTNRLLLVVAVPTMYGMECMVHVYMVTVSRAACTYDSTEASAVHTIRAFT